MKQSTVHRSVFIHSFYFFFFFQEEDDGIILSALVWGRDDTNRVGLLCLCAKTLKELGRYEFITPSPVPKCLHGWFAKDTV